MSNVNYTFHIVQGIANEPPTLPLATMRSLVYDLCYRGFRPTKMTVSKDRDEFPFVIGSFQNLGPLAWIGDVIPNEAGVAPKIYDACDLNGEYGENKWRLRFTSRPPENTLPQRLEGAFEYDGIQIQALQSCQHIDEILRQTFWEKHQYSTK
jgi:hypothetical protein